MNAVRKAVIYCRVSSTKQVRDGDGLASQETRCREFAARRGYEVVEVIRDDVSGGLKERPGMKAMLAFLKRQKKEPHVVLIDDISRLARGVEAHIQLRAAITMAGGILESPSVEFGEDADSELREYILATVAQHQRRKNAEQTKNRMRARFQNGYWPFFPPIGYRFEKVAGHGKLLVPSEPLASIIAEGFEGYASGRFQTLVEVKRFFEAQPAYPRNSNNEVHFERVNEMFSRPVYVTAGFRPHRGNAARLRANENIKARITELLEASATETVSALSFSGRDLFVRLEAAIEKAQEAGDHKSAIAGHIAILKAFGYLDSPTLTHEHVHGTKPSHAEAPELGTPENPRNILQFGPAHRKMMELVARSKRPLR